MWYGWYVSCASVHFTDSAYVVPQSRVFIPYPSTCSECKRPRPKVTLLFLQRQQAHRCPTARIQRISNDFNRFPVLTGMTPVLAQRQDEFSQHLQLEISPIHLSHPVQRSSMYRLPKNLGDQFHVFFPGMENQKTITKPGNDSQWKLVIPRSKTS